MHNRQVNGRGGILPAGVPGYRATPGDPAVLGIDLGTSAVKVLVTTPDGQVLGRAAAGYPVRVPSAGRAETAPADWWLATRAAVREALAEAEDGPAAGGRGGHVSVTALAVAGQMHGVVLADERGDPLRPAILWLDQRATAEAASYADLPGGQAVLGNPPSPGMAGPLLSWLVAHEPCTVTAAWWVLQPKDWLRLRLTGRAATDPTDASGTLLFDLDRGTWADTVVEKLGLPREKLPPLRRPADVAGPLLAAPAADLGLPPGIPVAVGAADTAAALYAVGLGADEAMLNLGSGGQWVVPEPEFRPAATTNLYRAVDGGYYRLAPVQNVGITLDWVRNLLGATWEDLYATASVPPAGHPPRFDPRLTPERWSPGVTGAWTGLTRAHQREDLMRSALDGVATLLRQRLDDLRAVGHHPRRVLLGGGGATSAPWRALLQEALGLPVREPSTTWLTSTGAARLAARAAQAPPGPGPAATGSSSWLDHSLHEPG
jgi:xylulokinase